MRSFIGISLGLAPAILAFYISPKSGIEQVNAVAQAAAEKTRKDFTPYTDLGLRVIVFAAVLLGAWWMTEAIPLAAIALLPFVIFPAFQVTRFKDVAAPYAFDTIFLFMGGFMLVLVVQRWNLCRRIALGVVLLVGVRLRQLTPGFMIATGFLSIWVSNTATTIITLPIGMFVLILVADLVGGMDKVKRFATALMFGIAYLASIGSAATIIGIPPSTLLVAYLVENHDINIGLGQWMLVGVPLVLIFPFFAWWLMVFVTFKPEVDDIPGGRESILQQWKELGRMNRGEVMVAVIFVLAALSWAFVPILLDVTGSALSISDSPIAMIAAALLFLIPMDIKSGKRLFDWKTMNDLPWNALLLFGGGPSLSAMFSKLGLSLWIGEQAKGLGTLPILVIVTAVATLIIFLTELISSTVTIAAFLPIMGGVAVGTGVTAENPINILLFVVPVVLAVTFISTPPVATLPNAVVYGSGYIKAGDTAKTGLWFSTIGVVLITVVVLLIGVSVFGLIL